MQETSSRQSPAAARKSAPKGFLHALTLSLVLVQVVLFVQYLPLAWQMTNAGALSAMAFFEAVASMVLLLTGLALLFAGKRLAPIAFLASSLVIVPILSSWHAPLLLTGIGVGLLSGLVSLLAAGRAKG